MEVVLEIYGLQVFAHHGVLESERLEGQSFLIDVTLVAHDAGVRSDKLSDTVDYTRVAACVREVATSTRFNLIEALAAAIADALGGTDLIAEEPPPAVLLRGVTQGTARYEVTVWGRDRDKALGAAVSSMRSRFPEWEVQGA